jgi:hypothetical protein
MDIKAAGTKRKIQIAKLEEWREKLITVPNYTRKEPKGGTKSESRSSNSGREIRYFSLTLAFIYLVMVSFVIIRKALT